MTTITESPTAPAAGREAWSVQVDAILSSEAAAKANPPALESMIELILRTQDVRSAWLVESGEDPAVLTVQISLAASSWTEAVGRATEMVRMCAGYAGLRGLSLRQGRLAA